MSIVINRKTGEILEKPEYTQEEKDRAWEVITRGWVARNQDVLLQLLEREGIRDKLPLVDDHLATQDIK